MNLLKGCRFPKDVVLHTVYYRDLEEIMAERVVQVDHATLNEWVIKQSSIVAARAQS